MQHSNITRLKKTGIEVDYDYCKGCGICAAECPTQSYEMVPEEK